GVSAPSFSGTVSFQTTDPLTNASTGHLNTPVDVPAHGIQTFLITVRSSVVVRPTDISFTVAGDTAAARSRAPGVDTVLFSASSLSTPTPDIIAVAATVSGDGIVVVWQIERTELTTHPKSVNEGRRDSEVPRPLRVIAI